MLSHIDENSLASNGMLHLKALLNDICKEDDKVKELNRALQTLNRFLQRAMQMTDEKPDEFASLSKGIGCLARATSRRLEDLKFAVTTEMEGLRLALERPPNLKPRAPQAADNGSDHIERSQAMSTSIGTERTETANLKPESRNTPVTNESMQDPSDNIEAVPERVNDEDRGIDEKVVAAVVGDIERTIQIMKHLDVKQHASFAEETRYPEAPEMGQATHDLKPWMRLQDLTRQRKGKEALEVYMTKDLEHLSQPLSLLPAFASNDEAIDALIPFHLLGGYEDVDEVHNGNDSDGELDDHTLRMRSKYFDLMDRCRSVKG
eukprot:Clim_evm76s128 gene=Clim_evmTU76s128